MMPNTPIRRTSARGFTLIETLATISVLAILGSITSFILVGAVEGYVDAATQAQLHAEASVAMDRALRELRWIELNTDPAPCTIGPHIDSVTDKSITWDNVLDGVHSLVWSGTSGDPLTLAVDGGAAVNLQTDVTAFTVAVYDDTNTVIVLPLADDDACCPIRRIALDLTVNRSGKSMSVRTKLFVRSTMSGGGT